MINALTENRESWIPTWARLVLNFRYIYLHKILTYLDSMFWKARQAVDPNSTILTYVFVTINVWKMCIYTEKIKAWRVFTIRTSAVNSLNDDKDDILSCRVIMQPRITQLC